MLLGEVCLEGFLPESYVSVTVKVSALLHVLFLDNANDGLAAAG